MTETINIWCGETELYDDVRPHPPAVLLAICTQLARAQQPALVVDLGSGTGLSTEAGNAERFIGLTLSYGIARFLKQGYLTEQEVGLDHLKRLAQNLLGPEPVPWYFSYRVRIGIK